MTIATSEWWKQSELIPNLRMPGISDEEIEQLLPKLTRRECQVLRMRFGIGMSIHTSGEIVKKLGVSKERVKQLRQAVLRKLEALRECKVRGCQ